MNRKMFSLAIALLFVTSAAAILTNPSAVDADGGGAPVGNWTDSGNYNISWYTGHESDSSYTISTAEELAGISYLVMLAPTKVSFSGKSIIFDNSDGEIDLSAHYWMAIGNYFPYPFAGNFDGQNIVIRGLYIGTETTPAGEYQGLFGYIDGGTIKNIGIEDGEIYGSNHSGSIAGSVRAGGTVENCYNKASVSGGVYAGGIVGTIMAGGTIENCYNKGVITGISSNGGIVGGSDTSPHINYCYNTGDIFGNYSGGIIGILRGATANVTECYNTGNITGNDSGGVIGFLHSGTAKNCYNVGNITGVNRIGGLVGNLTGGTFENCYTMGEVNGSGADCGPLHGFYGGTYTNSYWLDTTGFPLVPGESLSLDEMTGIDAVTTMGLGSGWETKKNGGGMYYSPQLEVFSKNTDPIIVSDSLKSVTFGDLIKPVIAQTDTPEFEKGQKLSDLNPADYVTVTPYVPGTFSWEDPDMVLDTVGDFKAKIIFTPTETEFYLPLSIDADITVVAPEPGPGPGPEPEPEPNVPLNCYLFFAAAIITGIILFYIGVVKEE